MALLGTALGQAPERIAAIHSLQPFARPSLQFDSTGTTALPGETFLEVPSGLLARPATHQVGWLHDLLTMRHATAIGADQLALGGEPPQLLLLGTPAAVAACEADLAAIEAIVARPIEVTAYWLPLPAGPLPATVWSSTTLQTNLTAAPPRWTGRARTRARGGVRLGQERWIGHVYDFDVEAVSATRIDDPKVDAAFAGVRVGLRVHALERGELVLSGQWLLSEPQALHEVAAGQGQPTLQLPEHRTLFASFAGRIENGGALAVSGRGGRVGPAEFLLVMSARYAALEPGQQVPAEPAGLLIRHVSAVTDADTGHTDLPPAFWRLGDDTLPGEDQAPVARTFDDARLGSLLADATGCPCRVEDGLLLLEDTPASIQHVDTVLRSLLQRELRTLEVRSAVQPANGGDSADHQELAQPALPGRPVLAFLGHETAAICDYEVEISQGVSAMNPVVRGLREGLWTRLELTAANGDPTAWNATGTWVLAAQAPLRVHEHTTVPPGTIQLADAAMTAFPWDGPIPLGRPLELGDGPPWRAGAAPVQLRVRLQTR